MTKDWNVDWPKPPGCVAGDENPNNVSTANRAAVLGMDTSTYGRLINDFRLHLRAQFADAIKALEDAPSGHGGFRSLESRQGDFTKRDRAWALLKSDPEWKKYVDPDERWPPGVALHDQATLAFKPYFEVSLSVVRQKEEHTWVGKVKPRKIKQEGPPAPGQEDKAKAKAKSKSKIDKILPTGPEAASAAESDQTRPTA